MKQKTDSAGRETSSFLPVLCAWLGNAIWGLSFMFTKGALEYASMNVLVSMRFLIASLLMTVWMLVKRQKITFRGKNWKALLLLMLAQILYYRFESLGILYTNATVSGLVLAVVPVVAMGSAYLFLKEKPTLRQALFCLLPIAGVIVMTVAGKELGVVQLKGVVFLILTCLASAVYKTANRRAGEDFTSFERSYMVVTISGLSFFGMALQELKGDLGAYFAPMKEPGFWVPVLVLSVFCSIAANLLVNFATQRMSVVKLSSFGAVSTLVSTVAGVVFLKEPVSAAFLVGAALILVGVQQVTKKEETTADEEHRQQ